MTVKSWRYIQIGYKRQREVKKIELRNMKYVIKTITKQSNRSSTITTTNDKCSPSVTCKGRRHPRMIIPTPEKLGWEDPTFIQISKGPQTGDPFQTDCLLRHLAHILSPHGMCERRVPCQFVQLLSVGDVDFPVSFATSCRSVYTRRMSTRLALQERSSKFTLRRGLCA